ncbi:hypothetical protein [Solitalea koreensis]|uniref:Uncharacterized protein n=1 Tax=Solitalea koreensis TaxID=543615 RepID=A0A521B8Y6_9SPHI|nr:hypothetical protein [Solitalea koreensis]SMO43556.1 hypothetical protein SAMN06265350_10213 [Solitalea koreensis]
MDKTRKILIIAASLFFVIQAVMVVIHLNKGESIVSSLLGVTSMLLVAVGLYITAKASGKL